MLKEILAATLDSVEQLQHIFFQLSSGLGMKLSPLLVLKVLLSSERWAREWYTN
jgi:hypothetical protein